MKIWGGGEENGKNLNFSKVFVDFFEKLRIIIICMDKKKECMIPQCGDLAELKKNKVVVGAKQLRKALQNGRAKAVFIAKNADPFLTEPLTALCNQNHVQINWIDTMLDLGAACGIDVGAAAAAVVE